MNLEQILKQIKADSAREEQEILADGTRQAEALLQKARDEVEGSRQRILKDAQYRRQRETSIIMRQGIMETLRFQAEARRKLVDAAMLEASNKMDELYALEGYPEILNRFAQEALADLAPSLLPGQAAILRFDPKDKDVPLGRFALEGHECRIAYDLKTKGGCIAQSEDGKVVVFNTIEERIKNGLPQLRQQMWQLIEQQLKQ